MVNNILKLLLILLSACGVSSFKPNFQKDAVNRHQIVSGSFMLGVDSIWGGSLDIADEVGNKFEIKNNGESRLCLSPIVLFSPIIRDDEINVRHLSNRILLYYPELEYYDRMKREWEKLNFDSLMVFSDPQGPVLDSLVCFAENYIYSSQLRIINLIGLPDEGLYRVRLKCFIRFDYDDYIVFRTNYEEFYNSMN